MKVEPDKVPLAPAQRIPPAPVLAVLLIKIQSIKLPLVAFQKTAPPILAKLLINSQSFNTPSVPFQKTAPPFPFWKLKFPKINYLINSS